MCQEKLKNILFNGQKSLSMIYIKYPEVVLHWLKRETTNKTYFRGKVRATMKIYMACGTKDKVFNNIII